MTDSLRTLSDHHPDLRVHAPRLAGDVGPLLAEAKIARAHAVPREAGGLDLDLANLADGVAGLVALLRAGVSTEDVAEAEGNLRVLALNLRQDCARIISERGREVRLDTEAAVLRKRQDVESVDVSEAFRAVFAEPAAARAGGFVSEAALPLPEAGGPVGRVEGRVLTLRLPNRMSEAERKQGVPKDVLRRRREVAPSEAVFLPEGTETVLRCGEAVVIHNAGYAIDAALDIREFRTDAYDLAVEAQEDGVRVIGPASLSAYPAAGVTQVKADATRLRAYKTRMSAFRRPGFAANMLLFGTPVSLGTAGLASSLGALGSSASNLTLAVATILPGIVSLGSFFMTHVNINLREAGLTDLRWITPECRYESDDHRANTVLEYTDVYLNEAETVRFYPSRKIMTRDKAGARILRPSLRLPGPAPEFVTPASVKEATK